MASTLISNLSSHRFEQANILTNRPERVKAIVEDEEDVVIWQHILAKWAPGKRFEITPFHSVPGVAGSKGKGHILAMAAQFGPAFIGCVDSDYDYILESNTPDGAIIKSSPYLLQTFAYSLENLVCQPYKISEKLCECKRHACDIDTAYTTFLSELSAAVYPVLLWHLTLKKETGATDSWAEVLNNESYRPIINDSTLSPEQKCERIISKLQSLAAAAETRYAGEYPQHISAKNALETRLSWDYSLSPENAYLYVRGHDLFEFLHFTFFGPIEDSLYHTHIADINSNLPEKEAPNAINHYRSIVKEFKTEHLCHHAFLDDDRNSITAKLRAAVVGLGL